MSYGQPEQNDRLIDLAIECSTTGLSETEQQEFNALALSPENQQEAERFELTAAALDLSYTAGRQEGMPRDVHDRLLVAAGEHFGSVMARRVPDHQLAANVEVATRNSKGNRFSMREAIALAVTAACVALLLSGYNPFARSFDQSSVAPVAALPKTPTEKMEALLAANPADLVDTDWSPPDDPKSTKGKVFWSDSRQEGYMVFDGLPVNDPAREQYQLWIFDTVTTQEHPVDGGVFDIAATGKSVVPINARIPVNRAVMFAITIEKPGGVVVSDRKRLPVLAQVPSSPLP